MKEGFRGSRRERVYDDVESAQIFRVEGECILNED